MALRAAADQAARGVTGDNAAIHELTERALRVQAKAQRAGYDVQTVAHKHNLGALEIRSERLLGGIAIGAAVVAKQTPPSVIGGYDPTLNVVHTPPVVEVPAPSTCVDKDGRRYKGHALIPIDDGVFDKRWVGGRFCYNCGRKWTKAEARAMGSPTRSRMARSRTSARRRARSGVNGRKVRV